MAVGSVLVASTDPGLPFALTRAGLSVVLFDEAYSSTDIICLLLDGRSDPIEPLARLRARPGLRTCPALFWGNEAGAAQMEAELRMDQDLPLAAVVAHCTFLANLGALHRMELMKGWAEQVAGTGLSLADVRIVDAPLVYVSAGFTHVTGYSAADVLGKNCRFLQVPSNDEKPLQMLRDALKVGEPCRVVLRNRRKDQSMFWNELTLVPIRDDAGQLTHYLGMQRDVSAAVEEEDKAQARHQLTSTILDGLNVAVISTDSRGNVRYINQEALRILGIDRAHALHRSVAELFEGQGLAADLGGTESVRIEFIHRRADGGTVEIGATFAPPRAELRDRLGHFITFRDLTEQRLREHEVRRAERLVAMGTMVSGFAHEVRNPVASLRLLSEQLIVELPAGDPRTEYTTRILKQVERIERLVSASLRFGRPATPKMAKVSGNRLLDSIIEAVQPLLASHRAVLSIAVDAALPDVRVDEGQLVQVVLNLLSNALDAARSRDGVTLRARASVATLDLHDAQERPVLRIDVIDDGIGIPDAMMSQVFDPFFTTKPSGTGLGLSIAQQLMHEHAGRLQLQSAIHTGTMASVLLPIAKPNTAA